jgi:hypothetical protein
MSRRSGRWMCANCEIRLWHESCIIVLNLIRTCGGRASFNGADMRMGEGGEGIMTDIHHYDFASHERVRPARAARGHRQELATGEPIDIYHWAAVALVTALMCAVLGYAAGTAALARAANVTSLVFGLAGGALVASGLVRSLRARGATGQRLAVPIAETH